MLTGATWPARCATSLSTSSSASLSTLKQPMPTSSARRISARVLPTPEKMMSPASAPAASTRSSSPPETMSKPQPACGEDLQHAERGVGLHRIADLRLAAREAALVGRQRGQHRTPWSRRTAACRARAPGRQPDVFDEQLAVAAVRSGDGRAGSGGGSWCCGGGRWPVPRGWSGAEARRRLGVRGLGQGGAALAAASPVGRYSGPFWPQPANAPTAQTARASRARGR